MNAADRAACESAFAALRASSGIRYAYLAVSQGDEVSTVASVGELRSFLGPIDTREEAVFLAWAEGNDYRCGGPTVRARGQDFEVVSEPEPGCGQDRIRYLLRVSRAGVVTPISQEVIAKGSGCIMEGRRPVGLRTPTVGVTGNVLGTHFARVAHLEAASVPAFIRLAAELKQHGASPALQRRALAVAEDEVRHARTTSALARRFGGVPPAPIVNAHPLRSRVEVAVENVAEGCVRETFAAFVAHHQAAHSKDRRIQRAMRVIAADETRHAELAWDVARWAATGLTEGERAEVRAARDQAVAALRREVRGEIAPELVEMAGRPTAEAAEAMVEVLAAKLWRDA